MKKEVIRRRKLPAFVTDLGGFELLLSKLIGLFPDGQCRSSITVNMKNQEFDFESVEEMRNTAELPDNITSFSFWLSGGGKRVSFDSGGFPGFGAKIRAVADNEAWCAGAIETTVQFSQQNRTWYSWIRGWPIVAITTLALYVPFFMSILGTDYRITKPNILFTWLSSLLILCLLALGQSRLLPAAVLRIRSAESFARRHVSELTLVISLLALFLTVIGWFIKK